MWGFLKKVVRTAGEVVDVVGLIIDLIEGKKEDPGEPTDRIPGKPRPGTPARKKAGGKGRQRKGR